MAKHKNLQPWLDYFPLLQTYEEKGFLQMEPEKHEAYVTQPALLTLANVTVLPGTDMKAHTVLMPIVRTLRRLRTYAAFMSQHSDYLSHNFAVHVVKPEGRPDPLYTVVMTRRRAWWKLWLKADVIDVISYD